MSYIEMQLTVTSVAAAISGATNVQLLTSLGSAIGKSFAVGSTTYVVQNVQVGSTTLLPPAQETYSIYFSDGAGGVLSDTVPAVAILFSTPVTYQLLAMTSTNATSVGPLALAITYSVSVTEGPPPQFNIAPDGVTGGGSDATIAAALQGLVNGAISAINQSLSIGNYQISNTGVAVDASSNWLAIRLQTGLAAEEDYTKSLWTLFYRGTGIQNHLVVGSKTGNVSLFLTSDLAIDLINNGIESGIAAHSSLLRLDGGITSTWAPTSTQGAHVDSTFKITATPTNLPNVDANMTMGSDISIANSPSDTLQTDVHVTWDVNLAEEILDVIISGFTASLFGAELTGGLGAIPGFIGGVIAAIVGFDAYQPSLSSAQCTQKDKNDITCTSTIQKIPNDPISGQPALQFTSAAGAPDGLVLFSQLSVHGVVIRLSMRQFLQTRNFNFAKGLRSLGAAVVNAQYAFGH
jgi:hypothetical protein